MKEIDWSQAPEGATHYQPHQGAYYKHSPLHRCWLVWASDNPMGEPRWHQAHGTDEKQLIARPAAWDGTGLPPVGTVCEALISGGWYRGTVIGHCVPPRESFAAFQGDGLSDLIFGSSEYFRPIRPDPIAAEEREKALKEMAGIVFSACGAILADDVLSALYDAGYRRQEPQE